ncbi:PREDICTED: unconventional myosin-XIX-like isoform X2 [Priapulus caudatus]|uniref:Unconventional myosin-XIX-like isoform X2 n=1 Tax=Priapulus caudatus TaxID=37621 RepID=A0ABM1DVR7_PRICU|nr:PREDICTED: unconventional myosin-XIX-like isoform X2 [Priapulus caudatus]
MCPGVKVFAPHPELVWSTAIVDDIKESGSIVVRFLDNKTQTFAARTELPLAGDYGCLQCENLTQISPLSNAAVLDCIRDRSEHRAFYTRVGNTLLAVNPCEMMPTMYGNRAIGEYSRAAMDLPPHVFSVADAAYRELCRGAGSDCGGATDQAIIISGESGAGKTCTARYIMKYLTSVAVQDCHGVTASTTTDANRIEMKILDSNPILEAFGNASTVHNGNSSRFGKFVQMQYGARNQIVGARLETYLLEKTRVIARGAGERNFHIFYQMLCGANAEEMSLWQLERPEEGSTFNYVGDHSKNHDDDKEGWCVTKDAMSDIGLSFGEQNHVFVMLSAILHLGNVTFEDFEDMSASVVNEKDCSSVRGWQLSARLLGVDPSKMAATLTVRTITASHRRRYSIFHKPCSPQECITRRDCLAKLLYNRIFRWMVEFINVHISTADAAVRTSIGLLDVYGFESLQNNSLEQLCINYTNEKLQQHFVKNFIKLQEEEHIAERLQWLPLAYNDNQESLMLLEGTPGIFTLLNEECRLMRESNSASVADRIVTQLAANRSLVAPPKPSRKCEFVVRHYAGDVVYVTDGMVDKNKDKVPEELTDLLRNSKNVFVSSLFCDSEDNVDDDHARGRPNQKQTVLSKFKESLVGLMSRLERMRPHYIRCIRPNARAAPRDFDSRCVMAQLEACGVLAMVQISKACYPDRISYEEFSLRYRLLLGKTPGSCKSVKTPRQKVNDADKENAGAPSASHSNDGRGSAVKASLSSPCINGKQKTSRRQTTAILSQEFGEECLTLTDQMQFGRTKVFLKDKMIGKLEASRAILRTRCASVVQRCWRRYVAACQRQQQQQQHEAASRIQAAFRRWKVRRTFVRVCRAAITVQCWWRCLVVTRRIEQQELHRHSSAGDAATTIADKAEIESSGHEEVTLSEGWKSEEGRRHAALGTTSGALMWHSSTRLLSAETCVTLYEALNEVREGGALTYPNLPHLFHRDGLLSVRRMPRVNIRFHTKPNKILKNAHLCPQKEFRCSLLDCLLT